MNTKQAIFYSDARDLSALSSESVHLIITSPPYPMISMWDECFSKMNPDIKESLKAYDGDLAYKLMHIELQKVWQEAFRVLKPGGFACINIGDATRSIGKIFKLYPNQIEIISFCMKMGFEVLPKIIWRKTTNAPTKFMGSGMLPCGAYVTLEHESILILRKPKHRSFSEKAMVENRRQSAFFWEERNQWFSDVWDLTGERQAINAKAIRKRSGAYPLEIPLRLIRMYSSKGDVVLDPFLGTGTTTLASIICCRNSIGFEVDSAFKKLHRAEISSNFIDTANGLIHKRIYAHNQAMDKYSTNGHPPKYRSKEYDFPVMTRQEIDILFNEIVNVEKLTGEDTYRVDYQPLGLINESKDRVKKSANKIKLPIYRGIYKQ